MGWIVAIWMRLTKLIEKKEGPTTKLKYIINIKKNFDPGSLGPFGSTWVRPYCRHKTRPPEEMIWVPSVSPFFFSFDKWYKLFLRTSDTNFIRKQWNLYTNNIHRLPQNNYKLKFKLLTKSTKEGIRLYEHYQKQIEYSYNDNKNKDFSSRIDNSKPLHLWLLISIHILHIRKGGGHPSKKQLSMKAHLKLQLWF